MLQFWGRRLPQSKGYSSERKGILAFGSQGIPQSHTVQQTSHRRFLGREKPRRVITLAQARSCRELRRKQGLYRVSWGVKGWSFPGLRFPGQGLVEFQVLILRWAQGLVRLQDRELVGFQVLSLGFLLCRVELRSLCLESLSFDHLNVLWVEPSGWRSWGVGPAYKTHTD